MQQGIGLIIVSFFVLGALLVGIYRFIKANPNSVLKESQRWIYALVIFFGLAVIFALLPIKDSAKNSVFSLLGVLITAVIAISSTTFVSNAMAGIMLRMIRHFKPGDFIEVGEHFGRVSEMGMLHTEIQTKSRNLTTLPNMYLVTNAVTVVPQDKALIDATLSLGYDVSHHDVDVALKSAAEKIGLTEAFVQVTDLGDFSISYRVAGYLADPKLLLSVRSNLRKQMIDSLHAANIEIVSPTFMNQRQFRSDAVFMSDVQVEKERKNADTESSGVFDKAETAALIEALKAKLAAIDAVLEETAGNDEQQALSLQKEKAVLQNRIDQLNELLDQQTQRRIS